MSDVKTEYDWLVDEGERRFFSSAVHGLRSQGWPKHEAESEALERLCVLRDRDHPNPVTIVEE